MTTYQVPTARVNTGTFLAGLQSGLAQGLKQGGPIKQLPYDTDSTPAPVIQLPYSTSGNSGSSGGVEFLNNLTQNQQALTDNIRNQALVQAAQARLGGASSEMRLGEEGYTAPGAVPYSGPTGSKQEQGWIEQALKVLGMSDKYEPGIANIINHESSGNPNSINNWDSNAKAGHPSQGLMQTIPGTFEEYALPGYNKNILDPVSNIIAGVRYALKNYGKGMILAGGRHTSSGAYEGY